MSKKAILSAAAVLLAGFAAHAVSIDFQSLTAEIGKVKTEKTAESTSTIIEFKGPALKALFAILPKVEDENGPVDTLRLLNITNAGQPGVPETDTTSIYIECDSSKDADAPSCNITIINGVIPG